MDLINSFVMTIIGFLPFPQSEIYSDFTERGGATKVTEISDEEGTRLIGNLKGIKLNDGTRVGFIGIRRPIILNNNLSKVYVKVDGNNDENEKTNIRANIKTNIMANIKMRAVFSTIHTSSPYYEGDLTYQTLITPTNRSGLYLIDLNTLKPSIRGRSLDPKEAEPFKNSDVRFFSLEIKLSEQIYDKEDGLHFNFKVFWEKS